MIDVILIVVILIMVVAASVHIIRAKKRGQTCAGCASSAYCEKKNCYRDK